MRVTPRRASATSRQRLLAAAAAEFVAHGVAGARVDRIAADAQANKRLIYDYFGDKKGLFDAVLDSVTAEAAMRLSLRVSLLESTDIRQRV